MYGIRAIIVAHLLAAGTTGAVAWRTLRHRHVPGSQAFGVAMGAVAAWALLGSAGWLVGDAPVVLSLLYRLVWTPIGVIAVAWLVFSLEYTGRGDQVTPRRIAGVSVVPVIVAVAALCHGLLIPEYAALFGLPGAVTDALWAVESAWEPLSFLGQAYVYLLVGAGSILLVETLATHPMSTRGRALLALVVGPPWVLNALHLFVLDVQSFDPTILGFVVSGIAGLFAVGRFRLFEVPMARSRVVDGLDSGVLVYGRDGRVYDVNDRLESLLGIGPEALGRDVRQTLAGSPLAVDPGTDVPLFPDAEDAVSRSGDAGSDHTDDGDGGSTATVPGPETVVDGGAASLSARLDGATFPVAGDDRPAYVEVRTSTLFDDTGRPLSRVLRIADVTERERSHKELRRKNEFLDEFASVVSHDVATPLNVIENKARLIELTDDTAHATDIYEATGRVQDLVDQLETLAQQGKQVGDTGPVAFDTVAREAWHAVEAPTATLTVAGSLTVEADRDRLRQLLENLLRNSVEHESTSSPPSADDPVEVEVGTFEDGFYVADDGPGVDPADRDRIFEQGYSSDADGTGLGLAIVRRIAEGHGWSIAVTDAESGGARFEVHTED